MNERSIVTYVDSIMRGCMNCAFDTLDDDLHEWYKNKYDEIGDIFIEARLRRDGIGLDTNSGESND